MDNKIILEKLNESYIRVIVDDEDILQDLWIRYSEYQSGYQFSPKYKNRRWDGKIRKFSRETGVTQIGFTKDIISYFESNKMEYEMIGFEEEQVLDEKLFKERTDYFMRNSGISIRDYQEEAIRVSLEKRIGILLSCTGSGKSLMLYNIIRHLRADDVKRIVLIVPNITLITQMRDDFKDYGYDDMENEVTLLGGGYKPNDNPVLISTWESLQNLDKDFFLDIEAVFVDEAHGSRAKKLEEILNYCSNAKYKIGTTGTLPNDAGDILKIRSVIGDVIFELKSKDLIDRGLLSDISIAGLILKYPNDFITLNKNRSYPEEVKLVEEHEGRNKVLEIILTKTNSSHNSLILVNHIKHIDTVKEYLENRFPERKVSIITGKVKSKERDEIRIGMEDEDGTIILATYATMSTGVNIPKLHNIVLYANSKSKIKVLQSIGRGLRRHVTKDKIVIFDVIDDLSYLNSRGRQVSNYLLKHWRERFGYYTEQHFPTMVVDIEL